MFYNMLKIIEMEVTVMNTGTNITPITEDSNESKNMWSQFATSSKNGTRKHREKNIFLMCLQNKVLQCYPGF
jgi:hypothetical protein